MYGARGEGFLPGWGPEGETGECGRDKLGSPLLCKAHHLRYNPNMSLQRRKLKRETDNVAGREEKHEREENGKLV